MEGNIWVESQLGEGSTFHVEIPFHEVPVVEVKSSDDSQTHPVPGVVKAGLSILLADDAEENCSVMEAFLKNTPHRLTIVEDGAQAIEQFKKGDFDLILMDIQMPVMDGYEATRQIRAWEHRHNLSSIPVLALTANAMKEDIEKNKKCWLQPPSVQAYTQKTPV